MKLTFPLALGLLFIALKLTNHIDWSWWLVLLPIYAPFAFFGSIAVIGGICGLIYVKTETPAARHGTADFATEQAPLTSCPI